MTPSIYVIQKSTGMLYCVTVEHYKKYKSNYDIYQPVVEQVSTTVEVSKEAPKRTRKTKE